MYKLDQFTKFFPFEKVLVYAKVEVKKEARSASHIFWLEMLSQVVFKANKNSNYHQADHVKTKCRVRTIVVSFSDGFYERNLYSSTDVFLCLQSKRLQIRTICDENYKFKLVHIKTI